MIEELEDVLIEITQQIMKLEDSARTQGSYLEAKKTFLTGIISQIETELQVLNIEYDNFGISLAAALEDEDLFEKSVEAYGTVMSSIFKH